MTHQERSLWHFRTIWSAVCSSVPHSQVTDEARPPMCTCWRGTVRYQYEVSWAWPMLVPVWTFQHDCCWRREWSHEVGLCFLLLRVPHLVRPVRSAAIVLQELRKMSCFTCRERWHVIEAYRVTPGKSFTRSWRTLPGICVADMLHFVWH